MSKYAVGGFLDRSQAPGGPITGTGPGMAGAMAKFLRRQLRQGQVGKWRCSTNARMYKNEGTFIDRDWDIIDY